ncbi:unnamed protein product [Periconia digitata]|uniref:Uncharacterized protein n=1 Tax=Periconia digitata TaxID=1303443 RepID=A0A9W4XLH3_9PLEO|nr:unnamed protein product [Periconia digitata]
MQHAVQTRKSNSMFEEGGTECVFRSSCATLDVVFGSGFFFWVGWAVQTKKKGGGRTNEWNIVQNIYSWWKLLG